MVRLRAAAVCMREGTDGAFDVLVCARVLRSSMFELFSRMAKKPTLTKLDDDGETQMDMCKLRDACEMRDERCAMRSARTVAFR